MNLCKPHLVATAPSLRAGCQKHFAHGVSPFARWAQQKLQYSDVSSRSEQRESSQQSGRAALGGVTRLRVTPLHIRTLNPLSSTAGSCWRGGSCKNRGLILPWGLLCGACSSLWKGVLGAFFGQTERALLWFENSSTFGVINKRQIAAASNQESFYGTRK